MTVREAKLEEIARLLRIPRLCWKDGYFVELTVPWPYLVPFG